MLCGLKRTVIILMMTIWEGSVPGWATPPTDASAMAFAKAQQQKLIQVYQQMGSKGATSLKKILLDETTLPAVHPSGEVETPPSPPKNTVLIFVSFSMPMQSLEQWRVQANAMGAPLILRGFVHHSLKETLSAIAPFLKDKKGGWQIDPPLFKRYGITQVPAVVLLREQGFNVVYGDVPLSTALAFLRNPANPSHESH